MTVESIIWIIIIIILILIVILQWQQQKDCADDSPDVWETERILDEFVYGRRRA